MYLGHMMDAAEKILSYTDDYTYQQFVADDKTYSAVIREILVIGEAANRVDKNFQRKHTEIPWVDIISTRNNLIHEYVGINPDILWKTIQDDIPKLRAGLGKLLD